MAFKHNENFPFSLLSDGDKSVGTQYKVLRDLTEQFAEFPKRVSYLIDPKGMIKKAYEVTDPQGHAGVVLADLEAAQR